MRPSSLRLFGLVIGPTPFLIVVASAFLVGAAVIGSTDPTGYDQTYALALMLQMFAGSTGYIQPARRGYFDPVLVTPVNRRAVAAAHFAVSIFPGAVLWTGLVAIDMVCRGTPRTGLTAAGLVAFVYVSATSWSVGLWMARYAAGVLWLAAIVGLAASRYLMVLRAIVLGDSISFTAVLQRTGADAACPLLLIAYPRMARPPELVLLATAAAFAFALGRRAFSTADLPLVESA